MCYAHMNDYSGKCMCIFVYYGDDNGDNIIYMMHIMCNVM